MFDECLTWKSHIQKVSSKIAIVAGTISRLKRFIPCDILKTIYNALIQPHLNFSILLWGQQTKRILKLQKWAVRAITCSKYNAHTDPLFKKLGLLKVNDIYKVTAIKFYYKFKNELLPHSFSGIFTNTYASHTYETRQRNIPRTNPPKSNLLKTTIRYSIPKIISELPSCITEKLSKHSIQGLSNYSKQYFLSMYQAEPE